jgi:hypothetical protein
MNIIFSSLWRAKSSDLDKKARSLCTSIELVTGQAGAERATEKRLLPGDGQTVN